MQFFQNCTTIDEVKSLYKKLAMQHHPDRGGDTATMQVINKEYAFACARLAKGAGLSEEEVNNEMNVSEAYRQAIEQIIHLPGITVELIGFWIWVTGDTKPVKDALRQARFIYAHKKQAWFFRTDEYKVSRGGKKSLDQIRSKYGSEVIHNDRQSSRRLAVGNS